jgi:hypothetical protein
MSFLHSQALQAAIYSALSTNASLVALVATQIYDAVPNGELVSNYVLIGEEKSLNRGDYTGKASRHDITISVVSNANGFSDAKVIASEICEILDENPMALSAGNMRRIQFRSARAKRNSGAMERRIDLVFRALIDA